MLFFENVRLAYNALKDRKVRSILTILMVVIGVSLITALNGMSGGFNDFLDRQLSNLSPTLLILTSTPIIPRFDDGPGQTSDSRITLNEQTINTIKYIEGVKLASPGYNALVRMVSGGRVLNVQLSGVDPMVEQQISPTLEVAEGAWMSSQDPTGMVLGYNTAYPPGELVPFARIGQTVTVEYTSIERSGSLEKTLVTKKSFVVKGILEPSDQLHDNAAYTTLVGASSLLKKSGRYDRIYVLTYDLELNDHVEERIKQIYGDTLSITSPKAILETVQTIISGFRSFILSIAAVSMIVGGVGILASLYTSVMERTREIGLLKALGFSDNDTLKLFLTESVMVGIIGGILGLVTGIIGGNILMSNLAFGGESVPFRPVFLLQDLITVFFFSLILAMFAGFYPAWRAAKLDPIVALKRE